MKCEEILTCRKLSDKINNVLRLPIPKMGFAP